MVRGGGQGVSIPTADQPPPACPVTGNVLAIPAASMQTPLADPALYKIHTFVCWLDRSDYKSYKALEGWVATLA